MGGRIRWGSAGAACPAVGGGGACTRLGTRASLMTACVGTCAPCMQTQLQVEDLQQSGAGCLASGADGWLCSGAAVNSAAPAISWQACLALEAATGASAAVMEWLSIATAAIAALIPFRTSAVARSTRRRIDQRPMGII